MLAPVYVLGVFTSEIGFCTPKIQSLDVLLLPYQILYARSNSRDVYIGIENLAV